MGGGGGVLGQGGSDGEERAEGDLINWQIVVSKRCRERSTSGMN